MKAISYKTHNPIEPFGDFPPDLLILNEPLRTVQARAVEAVNFNFFPVGEEGFPDSMEDSVVFPDSLFFTPEFLETFFHSAQERPPGVYRASLKKGLFTRQLAVLQDGDTGGDSVLLPLYFFRNARPSALPEKWSEVSIEADEFSERGRFPNHMLGKDSFHFCLTSRSALDITEAIHIPLANMAANLARVARFKKVSGFEKLGLALRALLTLPRGRAAATAAVLKGLSRVHPRADVHPTAVVEGSVIGEGAKVGAYAVVRFSVIGRDAFIDDHAGVKFSIIGDNAYIANNNVIFFSTVYPGSFLISGPYQFCCFGRDTAVMNSIPSDYRLDGGTVRVRTSKGVRDTGLRLAGSIVGHGTRIAAGLIIAPGRSIPGGITLYPDPARVLSRVDPVIEPGKVLFLRDGNLVEAP